MAKVATIVQLEEEQRKALDAKAKEMKIPRNELMRRAVDRMLEGELTNEQLQELDVISQEAEKNIQTMMKDVDEMNASINATVEAIEKMRKEAAVGRA